MKNPKTAITFVSLYLLSFALLGQLHPNLFLMLILFSISPFLLVWMVYTILKYGTWSGSELKNNEEWGYEDYYKDIK